MHELLWKVVPTPQTQNRSQQHKTSPPCNSCIYADYKIKRDTTEQMNEKYNSIFMNEDENKFLTIN